MVKRRNFFKVDNLMLLCFALTGIHAVVTTIRFLYAEFVYLPFDSAEFYTEMTIHCVFIPLILAIAAAFLLLTDLLIYLRKRQLQNKGKNYN